jgi:putative hydrolase of the HAD superfamily
VSADLRHIETWLFDLDNTLYPLESGLAGLMEPRITRFVMELTGLPRDEAYGLQKKYLMEHGLTLRGLMLHHNVDPEVYHAQFHDMPLDALIPDLALHAALARLPGRRLIFTNADDIHTARVLDRLGIADLFEDVFHIGSAAFEAKPSPVAFERIVQAHAIEPGRTAFFEDTERNLAPAAQLGMTTVLVGPQSMLSEALFVNHRTEHLAPFLNRAQIKETP